MVKRAGDGAHDHPDHQGRPHVRRNPGDSAPVTHQIPGVLGGGAGDGGGRQQEGEAGGGGAVQIPQQPGADGDPAAGNAGDQRQSLGGAYNQRIGGRDVAQILLAGALAVGPPHEQAHQDQHAADQVLVVAPDVLGQILDQQAGDAGGDGTEHQQPQQLRVAANRRVGTHIQAEALGDHLDPIAEEVYDHRRHRSHVQGDVEAQALVVPAQEPGNERQVRRAADREELGQALNDP